MAMVEGNDERRIEQLQESNQAPVPQFDNPLTEVTAHTPVTAGPTDAQRSGQISVTDVWRGFVSNLFGEGKPDSENPTDDNSSDAGRSNSGPDAAKPPEKPAALDSKPADTPLQPVSQPDIKTQTKPEPDRADPVRPGDETFAEIAGSPEAGASPAKPEAKPRVNEREDRETGVNAQSKPQDKPQDRPEIRRNADGSTTEIRRSPDGSRTERDVATTADGRQETLRHFSSAGIQDGELLTVFGADNKPAKTTEKLFDQQGNVTRKTETAFERKPDGSHIETAAHFDANNTPTEVVCTQYNANDHIRSSVARQYNPDGSLKGVSESVYDTDQFGRLMNYETKHYDKEEGSADRQYLGSITRDYRRDIDGHVEGKTTTRYDKDDNVTGIQETDYHSDEDGVVLGKEVSEFDAAGNIQSRTRLDANGRKLQQETLSTTDAGEPKSEVVNYDEAGNVKSRSQTIQRADGSYSVSREELNAAGTITRSQQAEFKTDGSVTIKKSVPNDGNSDSTTTETYGPGTVNKLADDKTLATAMKNLAAFGSGDAISGVQNVAALGLSNFDRGIEMLSNIAEKHWKEAGVDGVMRGIAQLGKLRAHGAHPDAEHGVKTLQRMGSSDRNKILQHSWNQVLDGVTRFMSDGNVDDAATSFVSALSGVSNAVEQLRTAPLKGASNIVDVGDGHHGRGIRRVRDMGNGDAMRAAVHLQVDGNGDVQAGIWQTKRFSTDGSFGSAIDRFKNLSPTRNFEETRQGIINLSDKDKVTGAQTLQGGADVCAAAGKGECLGGACNIRDRLGGGSLAQGGELLDIAGHGSRLEGVTQISGFGKNNDFLEGTDNLHVLRNRIGTDDMAVAIRDAQGFRADGESADLIVAGKHLQNYAEATNRDFVGAMLDAGGFHAKDEPFGLSIAAGHIRSHGQFSQRDFDAAAIDASGFTASGEPKSLTQSAENISFHAQQSGRTFDSALFDASGFTATGEPRSLTKSAENINYYAQQSGRTFDSALFDASGFTAGGEPRSLTKSAENINYYAQQSGRTFESAMVDASGFTATGEPKSLTKSAENINAFAQQSGRTFENAMVDASGFTATGEPKSLTKSAENINVYAQQSGRTFESAMLDASKFTTSSEGMSLTASAGHINAYAASSGRDFNSAMRDASGLVGPGQQPSLETAAKHIDKYAQSTGMSFDAASTDISRFVSAGQQPSLSGAAQNLQTINPNLDIAMRDASRFVGAGQQPSLAAGAVNLRAVNPDLTTAIQQISSFVKPGDKPSFNAGVNNFLQIDSNISTAITKLKSMSPDNTLAGGMLVAQQSLKSAVAEPSSAANTSRDSGVPKAVSGSDPASNQTPPPHKARESHENKTGSCPEGCKCGKAGCGTSQREALHNTSAAQTRTNLQAGLEAAEHLAQQENSRKAQSLREAAGAAAEAVARAAERSGSREVVLPASQRDSIFNKSINELSAHFAAPFSTTDRSGRDSLSISHSSSETSRTLAQVSISRTPADSHLSLPGATPIVTVARPPADGRDAGREPKSGTRLPGLEISQQGMQTRLGGSTLTLAEATRIIATASDAIAGMKLTQIATLLVPGRFLGTTRVAGLDGKGDTAKPFRDFTARPVVFAGGTTASAANKISYTQLRRRKSGELALTGAELALAALLITSAVAKHRDKDAEALAAQAKAGRADLAKMSSDGLTDGNKDEDSITAEYGKLVRPTWLVRPNEDLLKLAEHLFHDREIGWLIADLNRGTVKETEINGKRLIELRVRQRIILPVWQDIVKFHRGKRPANIDDLITIVEQTAVDAELMGSTLASAMGVAKSPTPAARPVLAKQSQAPSTQGITVTAAATVPSAREKALIIAKKAASAIYEAARVMASSHEDQGPTAGAAVTQEVQPRRQRDLRLQHLLQLTGRL